MKDDRAVKLKGEPQLNFKSLPHTWGDRPVLEPIQSNFTNANLRILLKLLPKLRSLFSLPSSLFPCIPRMHADEVATDQEFADIRIATGNMTVDVGHLPKRSFSAILIDSVAMPAVIFE